MNVLRRVLLAIYSILLIAAGGGLMALTWNTDKKLDLNIGDFNLQGFVTAGDTAKALATIVLAAIILIGLATLFLALAPGVAGGSRGTLRMRQADGGTVEVSADALESMLRDELEQLPEVREAYPRVRLSSGAVDTDTTVVIEPSANISHITGAVADATARALRENVGVTNVRRPSIRVRYDEMNARPVGVTGRSKPQAPTYAERELPPAGPPPAAVRADEEPAPASSEEPWPTNPHANQNTRE